jgi:hypothetical protein
MTNWAIIYRDPRTRCRSQRASTPRLAHVGAAWALPGRRVNARARGKAAGLLTAPRVVRSSAGADSFCQKMPSRAPAPAHHKTKCFPATCAAVRSGARAERASLSIARHPPPCMHRPASAQPVTSLSPACHQRNQHCQNPLTPRARTLPTLPATATGHTASTLPLGQSEARVYPHASDHRDTADLQCFGSVGSGAPLTLYIP